MARGRPKKAPGEGQDARLEVRLKKAQLLSYNAAAEAAGISRTEWVLGVLDAAAAASPEASVPSIDSGPHVDEALKKAYLACSRGKPKYRVRLTALRRALPPQISRANVDEALRRLFLRDEAIVLYPEDDGAALGPEDHRAALDVSGVAQHVIYWE